LAARLRHESPIHVAASDLSEMSITISGSGAEQGKEG